MTAVVAAAPTATVPADSATGGPAPASTQQASERFDGMRREWNFTLTLQHKAARASWQLVPQWVSTFIDPDDVTRAQHQDEKCMPIIPFYAYRDLTASLAAGEAWEEIPKEITLYYTFIRAHANTTSSSSSAATDQLKAYCKACVRHMLRDTTIVSVDGDTNLRRLKVGAKMLSHETFGGFPCFVFRHETYDRTARRSDFYLTCGTIINQRGYVAVIKCQRQVELDNYFQTVFLRHFRDTQRGQFDKDVTYRDTGSSLLKEQQQLFGELHYFDRDAALSFSIPMHPMTIRPDYSPTQTVGVGSVACMTLEIDVYERLLDELTDGDIGGAVAKHRASRLGLFLDVEIVSKMGYPPAMSVEQYRQLKQQKLTETFKDAKIIGQPLSVYLGPRLGRSTTASFTYDGGAGSTPVKLLMTSTLVGNTGASALYYTPLSQGVFDAHLYVYRAMAQSVMFHSERDLTGNFSRFTAHAIRVTEQDLPRAYSQAPVSERQTMEQHAKAIQASTDGRCDNAIVYTVDPVTLVAVRKAQPTASRGSVTTEDATALVDIPAGGLLPDVSGGGNVKAAAPAHIAPRHVASAEELDSSIISLASVDPAGFAPVVVSTGDDELPTNHANGGTAAGPGDGASGASGSPYEGDDHSSSTPTRPGTAHAPNLSSPAGHDSGSVPLDAPLDSNDVRPGTAATVGSIGEDIVTSGTPAAMVASDGVVIGIDTPIPAQSPLIEEALSDVPVAFGPSLRDLYCRSCENVSCRPNSYLYNKLPPNPRFTGAIEELDLTANYLGHQGFVAVLNLLEHLPKIATLIFDDMSLDNEDVQHLCEIVAEHPTITSISLRNNPKVTLPATRHLTRLIKRNPLIVELHLNGTSLGESLIKRLQQDAHQNMNAMQGDS